MGTQQELNYIEQEILNEINRHTADESYYDSLESENNEEAILNSLNDLFNYSWEFDNRAVEFFLKADQIEIWQYYIENVIPQLPVERL